MREIKFRVWDTEKKGANYGYFCEDTRASMDYEQEDWKVSEENIILPFLYWGNTLSFMQSWDT